MKADLSQSAFAVWRRRVLVILLWLAIWEGAYLLIGRDIYFPSPVSVVTTFFRLLTEQKTWVVIGWSLYRTLFAIVASAVLGVIFGMACGLNRAMYNFVNPLMVILKSTPVVSVIIISIIWFRSTDVPIFSGFLMCFPIVFSGTVAGVRGTDPKLVEMCCFYKVGSWDMLKKLYFPAAKPYINASVISEIGICWKAVAAAEVLSMPRLSIGANLYFAKTSLDPALLFAWTAIIILLSFVFETIYAKVSGYDKTTGRQ
ncbi:MAG: ABC transporter permease subunit [Oscillospiraceae bacterium]